MTTLKGILYAVYMCVSGCMFSTICKYMNFSCFLNYNTVRNNFWLIALSPKSVVFKVFDLYSTSKFLKANILPFHILLWIICTTTLICILSNIQKNENLQRMFPLNNTTEKLSHFLLCVIWKFTNSWFCAL